MPRPASVPVRLRGLLRGERALAALLPEAQRLRELNRLFARAVPPPIARACRVAAVQGGEAVVYCGNGAAAARLRAQAATVARALGARGQEIAGLKVKVRADWAEAPRPGKPGMSAKALAAWEALEGELHDEALKTAVARLIRHQRSSGG